MIHFCRIAALACIFQLLTSGQGTLAATPAPEATPASASRDLVSGEVPAAVAILERTLAPAPAPGEAATQLTIAAALASAAGSDNSIIMRVC